MKVFITGAEGFVGKELISQCKVNGVEVVAVDIVKGFAPYCYQADVCSKDIIDLIPQDADAIIHLSGLTRDSDCKDKAYECFNANVMSTLNLIDSAHRKCVKQFIFASTEWVYTGFKKKEIKDEESFIDIAGITSEYALSKLVSEANLRQKFKHVFCPVTILRFGIIYGPRRDNWSAVESILNSVATKDEFTVGSLRTGRHFIHVTDIASAIIKSIGLKGFEIINIQGDKLITLDDVIKTGRRLLNRNPSVSESSPDSPSVRRVSNKKAKQLLGWQPVLDLEAGLRSVKDFLGL